MNGRVVHDGSLLVALTCAALSRPADFGLGALSVGSRWEYTAGGALLVAAGVAWVQLAGRPTVLRLDRACNVGRLSTPRQFFSAGEVETFPLDQVRGVRVSEVALSSHDGPDSVGYEVGLEMKGGRVVQFSLERSRRAADRVV